MLIHLDTQADLEEAIHALVKQDPRLKPIFELAGMPALRRREPRYAGLAPIICGQQPSTASASAIWARDSAAVEPFHPDPRPRAAAHLWWAYYRAVKKREGMIGGEPKANAVLNKIPVAKRSPAKAKMKD